ncbi:probable pectinesterase 55 [Telopea speciosissima]|uniref:probable pectinesterase 55 n=1 Tax=Telopea speciosissima TaxID=54955 RepID=UPI001CC6FC3D|nr:probable pectinesterase 55 [Telopea speciosissima]
MWFHRSLVFVIFMVSSFRIWELSNADSISNYITVSSTGHGDFRTITEAIEQGIPENNNHWIQISVMPVFWSYDVKYIRRSEKVTVPSNKPFIILEGTSKDTTKVNWNGNSDFSNASLQVLASNFVARRITFQFSSQNTYNHSSDGDQRKQALAASIEGNKILFYDCRFISVQDTLFDGSGLHYFKNCYIEGAVDFIFGNGQSIYEDCNINVTAGLTGAIPGYITAQNREGRNESTGFVFKSCNISGSGPTYLGRAYGPSSRVIFYKCQISNIVVPEGWDAWKNKGKEDSITYEEIDNNGAGSDTSKRVPWINKLNANEVDQLVSISFIDADSWLGGIAK